MPKRDVKKKRLAVDVTNKRLQVDLTPELVGKLERVRRSFGLRSSTEAARVAIVIAAEGRMPFAKSDDDPLGIGSSWETSARLTRLSRQRFYRTKASEQLRAWGELLEEMLQRDPTGNDERLDGEVLRYWAAHEVAAQHGVAWVDGFSLEDFPMLAQALSRAAANKTRAHALEEARETWGNARPASAAVPEASR